MKFVCDSCRAQYMISDEKVGPNGVKVRCKKCSHVIVVKRPELDPPLDSTVVMQNPLVPHQDAPADSEQEEKSETSTGARLDAELGAAFEHMFSPGEEPPAEEDEPRGEDFERQATRVFSLSDVQRLAEEQGRPFELQNTSLVATDTEEHPVDGHPPAEVPNPAEVEWFVAIDDEQVGPLGLDDVRARWERSEIGPDTLCWRAGLADWRALSQVAELAAELAPRAAPVLRPASEIPVLSAAPTADGGREPLAWERAGTSGEGDPADEALDWKPAAASALASIVQDELNASKAPAGAAAPKAVAGPSRDAPVVAAETTGVRSLLGDLPEPPPPEPSRIIPMPVADRGRDLPERARSEGRSQVPLSMGDRERQLRKFAPYLLGGAIVLLLVVGALLLFTGSEPAHEGPRVVAADTTEAATPPTTPTPEAPKADAPPAEEPKAAEPVVAAEVAEPPPTDAAVAAEAVAVAPTPEAAVPAPEARPAPRKARPAAAPSRPRAHARPEPEPEPERAPRRSSGGILDGVAESDIGDAFDREFAPTSTKRKRGSSGGPGYIPPAPGAKSKPVRLGQGDIMGVVAGKKADIKQCVSRHRDSGGGSGTVVMSWVINPNGRPSAIKVAKGAEHRVFAKCVTTIVRSLRFPAYSGPTMSAIEFPFQF